MNKLKIQYAKMIVNLLIMIILHKRLIVHVKLKSHFFFDMKIDKKKLLDNFKHLKNVANLNILKCIKKLFSKISILKNIGFYILLVIIIFHIISLFTFYIKFLYKLKKIIKYIAYSIKHLKLIKKHNKRKELESKIT